MDIRNATEHDAPRIAALVASLSHCYLAPGHDQLPDWFANTITTEAFATRIADARYHHLCAHHGEDLAGYLAVRHSDDTHHLYHLFVSAQHHQQGIARTLWQRVIVALGINQCTVRSSLYAVPVYQRLGFVVTDSAATKDSIGYQPMAFSTLPQTPDAD